MFNQEFYPTPAEVIEIMLQGETIENKTILEPSAGKGDIVDYLNEYGDFNPSDMHILEYLESILTEEESQEEITAAANAGKQVSIYNLFSLVQEPIKA